jgi:hypothetical protein
MGNRDRVRLFFGGTAIPKSFCNDAEVSLQVLEAVYLANLNLRDAELVGNRLRLWKV